MKKKNMIFELSALLFAFLVFIFIWRFDGQWFWTNTPYNSYILQAQSWLEGRLDLGQDYPYLELAIKNGKYFVSFPPFPSYVMLPFVALGMNGCDSYIAVISSLLGVYYAMKVSGHYIKNKPISVLLALFVTVGSNWLFTATNAWVWFIAQNMAFTLSMMAIYYAIKGKAGLALAFWACAVGCRPFQAIYIFVLGYLLYNSLPEDKPINMIKRHWICLIAPFIIALSYMILNYMRFGSITEFGHNYLPEFMRVSTGQFNISYLFDNFPKLWRLPYQNGKIEFFRAEGFCIFIASPIFISYAAYTVYGFLKSNKEHKKLLGLILILFCVHLLSISMHRTMGGSHIGNRYTNDTLPFIYLAIVSVMPKGKSAYLNLIPFVIGLALNISWAISFFAN